MLCLRKQGQHQPLLDFFLGLGCEVVDIPHDRLMAGSIPCLLGKLWMSSLKLQMIPLLSLELLQVVMHHAAGVVDGTVDIVEVWCASVEKQPLRLMQRIGSEVAAGHRGQASLAKQKNIQLLHGALEGLVQESKAWLALFRSGQVLHSGLGMSEVVSTTMKIMREHMFFGDAVPKELLGILLAYRDAGSVVRFLEI